MALFTPRKYYVVTCKFGHVGRDKYLPLSVPIKAVSKKEASAKARRMGGVKRDHPDWCLAGPTEISKDEFIELEAKLIQDPYWDKKTRQNTALFSDRLVNEPNYTNHRGIKTNTVSFKKPTSAEVRSYRRRRQEIRLEELDFEFEESED